MFGFGRVLSRFFRSCINLVIGVVGRGCFLLLIFSRLVLSWGRSVLWFCFFVFFCVVRVYFLECSLLYTTGRTCGLFSSTMLFGFVLFLGSCFIFILG